MSGDKTEKATPKRLRELRTQGNVARSADAGMAAGTVALLVMLPALAGSLMSALRETMVLALSASGRTEPMVALRLLTEQLESVMGAVAGTLAVVAGAAVLGQVAVTRARPNLHQLSPKWSQLSPKAGFKRIFSTTSIFEGCKGVTKILIVGAVAYGQWVSSVERLAAGSSTMEGFMAVTGDSVMGLLTRVAVAAVLIGVIDAWWSRRRYGKQSRMTKDEVKQEHKQSDGDPQMKAARRSRQLAMGRNRMIEAVRDADVVVVNPTHIAIALKYEPGMPAPQVVARGAGVVATRIRERAVECRVTIRQHIPVARALYSSTKVGSFIPAELYDAVAVILAEIMAARSGRTS